MKCFSNTSSLGGSLVPLSLTLLEKWPKLVHGVWENPTKVNRVIVETILAPSLHLSLAETNRDAGTYDAANVYHKSRRGRETQEGRKNCWHPFLDHGWSRKPDFISSAQKVIDDQYPHRIKSYTLPSVPPPPAPKPTMLSPPWFK
ncbi:hypothetical protein DFH07DRAFT_810498 [Mycena maculata]|uniref:Uncharacterized protein n=1 Tax=Mycena maculata TaxID=230809 RepID=A0AAD7JIW9_9AGAR|nr:hypothetical protein DFH07DRAFT_810498 [Mycena maculata]